MKTKKEIGIKSRKDCDKKLCLGSSLVSDLLCAIR